MTWKCIRVLTVKELKCKDNSACLNGGTCVEDFPNDSYKCDCPGNRTGEHCESGEFCWSVRLLPLSVVSHSDDAVPMERLAYGRVFGRGRSLLIRRLCSDSSHVTAPYKLSFYYYYWLWPPSDALLHTTYRPIVGVWSRWSLLKNLSPLIVLLWIYPKLLTHFEYVR